MRDQLVANSSPYVTLTRANNTALLTGSALRQTVGLAGHPFAAQNGITASSFRFQISPANAEQWTDVTDVTLDSSGNAQSFNLDTTGVPDGTYDLRATPVDQSGKNTYATIPVRGVIIDNTPPRSR